MVCQAGGVLTGKLAVAEEVSGETVAENFEAGSEMGARAISEANSDANSETEISETVQAGIRENCTAIKENLAKVQKADARARVYLGRYYETVLTKFVVPLNLRLVENNLSAADLVGNQTKMAEARALFVDDYVNYQKELESLVATSCEEKAGEFYQQLVKVRKKRKIVEQDVLKVRNLISEHVKLAGELRGRL